MPAHRASHRGGIEITALAAGVSLHQTHPLGHERRLYPGVMAHQRAPEMQRHPDFAEALQKGSIDQEVRRNFPSRPMRVGRTA